MLFSPSSYVSYCELYDEKLFKLLPLVKFFVDLAVRTYPV